MPDAPAALRQEMIALLGRIVGEGPLPSDLQAKALEMFAAILQMPAGAAPVGGAAFMANAALAPTASAPTASAATAVGNRLLVYVHGICRHIAGFSDPWWAVLHPLIPDIFGPGVRGGSRLEVIWSDLVNQAAGAMAMAAGATSPGSPHEGETARRRAAAEIKEALSDRSDRNVLNVPAPAVGIGAAPLSTAPDMGALISIPGLNCVDDFAVYLTSDGVRQQIIDRFIGVVRPEIQAGRELDIISHSWGTVVAYEGLRQLDDAGMTSPSVRNWFTVGSALSLGPVKLRLREANIDGRKPSNVRRWVNLDARGDLVGGPLKGRPFAVDLDFIGLEAFGCESFLGVINPSCAHGSYFMAGNTAVNLSIFANFISKDIT